MELQRRLEWEDGGGAGVGSHVDDEYRWAGVADPKIILTTSRDPSSKLKQFAKVAPSSLTSSPSPRRGERCLEGGETHLPQRSADEPGPLRDRAASQRLQGQRGSPIFTPQKPAGEDWTGPQVTDFILVHEHRGVPDTLIVCHLPFGPTAYFTLANVVMRHDIPNNPTISEAFPHLIFHNFTSKAPLTLPSLCSVIP